MHRVVRQVSKTVFFLAMCMEYTAVHSVELKRTDDYVALIVEAEAFDTRDERWVLTQPDTPQQEQDPDGNHSDRASGATYLELLPDIRVTHDDPFSPPRALWLKGADAPALTYSLDIPEPGRYYVHVRAFSTGTEDNGLHVGFDGEWPGSGAALQLCTAHVQDWRWSSRQRNSGGVGPCGSDNTIWLDFEAAGDHEFLVSPREDGFELDQIMLIKDLSSNTRICLPVATAASRINCTDGSFEMSDGLVDVEVELESSAGQVALGESVEITATVGNDDGFDIATSTVLEVTLESDEWSLIEIDERCEASDAGVVCLVGRLAPGLARDYPKFVLTLQPLVSEPLELVAFASANEADDNAENDVASLVLNSSGEFDPTTITVSVDGPEDSVEQGESFEIEFAVANVGDADSRTLELVLELPDVLESTLPAGRCSGTPQRIECYFAKLGAGDSHSVTVEATGNQSGRFPLRAQAVAANADSVESEMLVSVVKLEVTVPEPRPVDTEPAMNSEPESVPVVRPESPDDGTGTNEDIEGSEGSAGPGEGHVGTVGTSAEGGQDRQSSKNFSLGAFSWLTMLILMAFPALRLRHRLA